MGCLTNCKAPCCSAPPEYEDIGQVPDDGGGDSSSSSVEYSGRRTESQMAQKNPAASGFWSRFIAWISLFGGSAGSPQSSILVADVSCTPHPPNSSNRAWLAPECNGGACHPKYVNGVWTGICQHLNADGDPCYYLSDCASAYVDDGNGNMVLRAYIPNDSNGGTLICCV